MNEPRYFVLVFGDPDANGDTVESGRYAAGDEYPPFAVQAGDMLLLYCTDGYTAYPKQFPGIGVALRTDASLIEHRWIPFAEPIPRASVESTFEEEDQKKMRELRFNTRRAFEISRESFARIIAGQHLGSLPTARPAIAAT